MQHTREQIAAGIHTGREVYGKTIPELRTWVRKEIEVGRMDPDELDVFDELTTGVPESIMVEMAKDRMIHSMHDVGEQLELF